MRKVSIIVPVSALLQACIVVQPPPSPSAVDQTSEPAPSQMKTPSSSQHGSGTPVNGNITISDAIHICKGVQEASDIPVGCDTQYFDGKPAMIMTFADAHDAMQWIEPLAEHVAVPYCNSANLGNREAYVVAIINTTNQSRIFRCETWEWGEWFSLDESGDKSGKPATIAEAARACRDIGSDSDVPIACEITYIQGRLAMVVGFPNEVTFEVWLAPFAEYLGGPFCNSANTGNRQAFLIFAINSLQKAKFYSCETNDVSSWIDLNWDRI